MMPLILENKALKLEIQKPGEKYRGSRFDWSGQIVQISSGRGITFCCTESTDPSTFDALGRGLYNEFGIDSPVGYDETPVGAYFHKIGTGLVLRDSSGPYDFYKPVAVQALDYRVEASALSVRFETEAPEGGGYAYRLVKIITLCDNTFSIWYELTNTGTKKIETNEYVHNFLSIGERAINRDYELSFPHRLDQKKFGETVNPERLVLIGENSISWKAPLREQFFFSHLEAGSNDRASWKLTNRKEGLSISESSLFKALRINLWGNVHVVSPEIFFGISIAAGETISWQRIYEINGL